MYVYPSISIVFVMIFFMEIRDGGGDVMADPAKRVNERKELIRWLHWLVIPFHPHTHTYTSQKAVHPFARLPTVV